MICDRCSEPIRKGEGYEVRPVHSPSGVAPDIVLHRRPCTPPLQQRYPFR